MLSSKERRKKRKGRLKMWTRVLGYINPQMGAESADATPIYVGPYHTQGPLCTYIRGSAIHVKPIDIWENQRREHGEHILIKGPSRKRNFSKWLCDWESPEAKGEIRTLSIQQLYRLLIWIMCTGSLLELFLWSIIDKRSPTRKVSLFLKSWGLMALLIGCSNTFLAASQSFTQFT